MNDFMMYYEFSKKSKLKDFKKQSKDKIESLCELSKEVELSSFLNDSGYSTLNERVAVTV